MSRRHRAVKRERTPDTRYKSALVSHLINMVMERGKKSVAERIVYTAIERVSEKLEKGDPIDLLLGALENIRPRELVEMKTLDFTVPYPLYEQVKRLLTAAGFETETEEFADLIRIRGELTAAAYPGLRTKLREFSNGRITLPEA